MVAFETPTDEPSAAGDQSTLRDPEGHGAAGCDHRVPTLVREEPATCFVDTHRDDLVTRLAECLQYGDSR